MPGPLVNEILNWWFLFLDAGLKKEIITMLEGSEKEFPEQELLDIAEKVRKFNW